LSNFFQVFGLVLLLLLKYKKCQILLLLLKYSCSVLRTALAVTTHSTSFNRKLRLEMGR